MQRHEIISYHRKRLAVQAAAEPYIKAQCLVLNTSKATLIIHQNGDFESRYPADVEKELAELRKMCDEAMEFAARQADERSGFLPLHPHKTIDGLKTVVLHI